MKRNFDFKTFMMNYSEFDTPMGTFAYDISRDSHFPKDQSYDTLLRYFERRESQYLNYELVRLFKIAWAFYAELA